MRPLVAWPAVAVLAVAAASACWPVVPPGYVSLEPRRRGAVDLEVAGGSGYPYVAPWVSLNVDPYVTSRLSIPVGLAAIFPPGGASCRVGARYRLRNWTSLGGGATLAFFYSDELGWSFHEAADLEWILGHRWRRVGLSFVLRTQIQDFTSPKLDLGGEFALAIFFARRWAWILAANGGVALILEPSEDWGVWAVGGGVGIMVQL